jgi:CRP-like cAMP-binding protein
MDAPLQLSAEDMRRQGYRTIDALTADRPVLKEASPAAMRAAIDAPPAVAEMHVILEGSVRMSTGDQALATLGAGELVGELTALDWGGGYGTLRSARVEAISDTRVLSLDPADVRELLTLSPAARAVIEDVAQLRLQAAADA